VVSIRVRTNSHVVFVTNDRLRYDHCYCLVNPAFFSLHIVPKIGIVSDIFNNVSSQKYVVCIYFFVFFQTSYFYKGGFVWDFYSYYIQHCFICRPSDSTVPSDAGMLDALTTRSHPLGKISSANCTNLHCKQEREACDVLPTLSSRDLF